MSASVKIANPLMFSNPMAEMDEAVEDNTSSTGANSYEGSIGRKRTLKSCTVNLGDGGRDDFVLILARSADGTDTENVASIPYVELSEFYIDEDKHGKGDEPGLIAFEHKPDPEAAAKVYVSSGAHQLALAAFFLAICSSCPVSRLS